MSDCDRCVHTYKSGNCLLGHNQTFTTIDNRVVNSSLEPDCPNFVLGYCVRDSSDSVRDSGDSVKDSSDSAKDLGDSAKDLSSKFDILRTINVGLIGGGGAGAVFYISNEIPTLDFITFIFCVVFAISMVIHVYDSPEDNDQDQDGDDQ